MFFSLSSLKEILDTCQVSKGPFYNFFGSKEDFAIEIFRHFQAVEQDLLQCQQAGSVRTDLDASALAGLIWNC